MNSSVALILLLANSELELLRFSSLEVVLVDCSELNVNGPLKATLTDGAVTSEDIALVDGKL